MGKRRERRRGSSELRGGRKGSLGGNARWPLILLSALVVGVGSYGFLNAPSLLTKNRASVRHRVPGGERKPTLSPALFGGVVARAYQIAREIPGVLDNLYCYCRCIENVGHRSLLSCYVDSHGAGCNVCVEQALVASAMTKQGKSPAEIQKELDRRFG